LYRNFFIRETGIPRSFKWKIARKNARKMRGIEVGEQLRDNKTGGKKKNREAKLCPQGGYQA